MEKPRPLLLVVYLLAVVVQRCNYIVYNLAVVVQQCNYIVALPLTTRKQQTMVGMDFSTSEVVY
jgi:hypothetical protein